MFFAEEMLKRRGESFEGKVCAVSGSGNVAQYTVEKLNQMGARCVTLSDSTGTIYDRDGINAEKLAFVMELKNVKRGRIREYADRFGCEYFEGKGPWGVACDCAFPSATQNEISGEDAATLIRNGCRLVAEGANMPSMPEAVDRFLAAKLMYAPGKASNAGGVATSGLEMSQNSMRFNWTREEVENRLRMIMVDIHNQCWDRAEEFGHAGNYVVGANIAGFMKVATAMLDQGLV